MVARVQSADVRQLPDFAPAYEWRINMVTQPKGITMPANDRFNTLCKSSSLPKAQPVNQKEVVLHNHKTVRPGTEFRNGELTLTMCEIITNDISKMVSSWRALNRDPRTGAAKVMYEDSIATITLVRCDRLGTPIYKYTLYGCWISDHDPGTELSNGEDSTGFENFTITLVYDDFYEESLV